MKHCPYCDPEEGEESKPVVDNEFMTVCVIGHTPIMNRRKVGSMQIYLKKTQDVNYVPITHCPVCGQPLYN